MTDNSKIIRIIGQVWQDEDKGLKAIWFDDRSVKVETNNTNRGVDISQKKKINKIDIRHNMYGLQSNIFNIACDMQWRPDHNLHELQENRSGKWRFNTKTTPRKK